MSGSYQVPPLSAPAPTVPAGCWETASAPAGPEGVGYRGALQAAGWEPIGGGDLLVWYRRRVPA